VSNHKHRSNVTITLQCSWNLLFIVMLHSMYVISTAMPARVCRTHESQQSIIQELCQTQITQNITIRVRTILGYWLLGDICRY